MTADTADTAFKEMFGKIPERDQAALFKQHGITNFSKLADKKAQLQQRQLKDVCSDVQMMLDVVCTYLESLDSNTSFTWEGLENFCDYNDNSGENVFDDSEQTKKKKENNEDNDPDGYNLTAEERKQMEQNVEDDPLAMKIRGFSPRALQFEFDDSAKKKFVEDASEKSQVAFNGSVYYVKKCYYYQQPNNGETVIVGIRKFTNNEKKAICALVVPFQETVMGPGLEEEPPIGVPATYEEDQTGVPTHVQVRERAGSEPIIPLSSLKPCSMPSEMPELLFERQQVGQPPHNFGYVYENDGKNRGEERDEIPFIDLFAGSGGFHQGVTQVPGFKGVAAVEWWETACFTFSLNNPETPVYCQKVEDFIEANGPTPTDFRKKHGSVSVVLASPPCQSFSGSNRDVDHNSEKDLYRKNLSLKFFDAVKTTGALIGVFENVEGMWRRPNIYFLKKIVLDHIRAGYQVRVRLHRAHFFGDPQARPRLLIYVAKKWVEMPNVIETHGPGKHPFMTVGNAFKALDKYLEKVKNNPNSMPPVPNLQGSAMTKVDKEQDILKADQPAGTIRCGGRPWHPTANRAIIVPEAATLQSYPYTYEFVGSLTDQYKQVGNAVPGKMAKAVALAIAESLRFVYDEEEQLDIFETVVLTDSGDNVSMEDDTEKEVSMSNGTEEGNAEGESQGNQVGISEEPENTVLTSSADAAAGSCEDFALSTTTASMPE